MEQAGRLAGRRKYVRRCGGAIAGAKVQRQGGRSLESHAVKTAPRKLSRISGHLDFGCPSRPVVERGARAHRATLQLHAPPAALGVSELFDVPAQVPMLLYLLRS
jgi:hypothetical protein